MNVDAVIQIANALNEIRLTLPLSTEESASQRFQLEWSASLYKKALARAQQLAPNVADNSARTDKDMAFRIPSGEFDPKEFIMKCCEDPSIKQELLIEEYELFAVAAYGSWVVIRLSDDDFNFEDLDKFPKKLTQDINEIRLDPTQAIPFLEEMKNEIVDEQFIFFTDLIPKKVRGAPKIVDKAIQDLRSGNPMPELKFDQNLVQVCRDCCLYNDTANIATDDFRTDGEPDSEKEMFKKRVLDRIEPGFGKIVKFSVNTHDSISVDTLFLLLILDLYGIREELSLRRALLDQDMQYIGIYTDLVGDHNLVTFVVLTEGEPNIKTWEKKDTKVTTFFEFSDEVEAGSIREDMESFNKRIQAQAKARHSQAVLANTMKFKDKLMQRLEKRNKRKASRKTINPVPESEPLLEKQTTGELEEEQRKVNTFISDVLSGKKGERRPQALNVGLPYGIPSPLERLNKPPPPENSINIQASQETSAQERRILLIRLSFVGCACCLVLLAIILLFYYRRPETRREEKN
eukprot:TRINITY_DN4477_c0_g1_i1.p1 TRINITY_DN4477_c0_g1~~TRINITY_DN4477_c0_g1_i1.p1  ORF type:complete len:519 (+),score=97.23 TRINITY_DN4477_c0_g1_i1:73-1629(+)